MFNAACIDLNYNSLTSAECINYQGKKNPNMCFLDIYSSETHFYKYWNISCQERENGIAQWLARFTGDANWNPFRQSWD